MANHSRGREDQRNDIIKVVTMMMMMTVTALYANRFGTIHAQIAGVLKGMEGVLEGFLPGDAKAGQQVRAHLSEALEEIAPVEASSIIRV
jgi:hypothetical protein